MTYMHAYACGYCYIWMDLSMNSKRGRHCYSHSTGAFSSLKRGLEGGACQISAVSSVYSIKPTFICHLFGTSAAESEGWSTKRQNQERILPRHSVSFDNIRWLFRLRYTACGHRNSTAILSFMYEDKIRSCAVQPNGCACRLCCEINDKLTGLTHLRRPSSPSKSAAVTPLSISISDLELSALAGEASSTRIRLWL